MWTPPAATQTTATGPATQPVQPVTQPTGQGNQAINPPVNTAAGTIAGNSGNRAGKVRRPPNAFILYRAARHREVKNANPGIHNNQICKSQPLGHLSRS